jgi:hypothetical protein
MTSLAARPISVSSCCCCCLLWRCVCCCFCCRRILAPATRLISSCLPRCCISRWLAACRCFFCCCWWRPRLVASRTMPRSSVHLCRWLAALIIRPLLTLLFLGLLLFLALLVLLVAALVVAGIPVAQRAGSSTREAEVRTWRAAAGEPPQAGTAWLSLLPADSPLPLCRAARASSRGPAALALTRPAAAPAGITRGTRAGTGQCVGVAQRGRCRLQQACAMPHLSLPRSRDLLRLLRRSCLRRLLLLLLLLRRLLPRHAVAATHTHRHSST